MARSHLGMKVYDNDWYLKYDLSYAAAAELLSDWGVDLRDRPEPPPADAR